MNVIRTIPFAFLSAVLAVATWASNAVPQANDDPARKKIRQGEINTPPARRERYADQLKVGDPAPDFTLPDPSGSGEVTLSSFRGKKPVVLVFGSFT